MMLLDTWWLSWPTHGFFREGIEHLEISIGVDGYAALSPKVIGLAVAGMHHSRCQVLHADLKVSSTRSDDAQPYLGGKCGLTAHTINA